MYKEQQNDLISKIITILNLDDAGSITLYDLEKDEGKINAIMKLIPDIRTYFAFGQIMGVKDPDKVKRSRTLCDTRCKTRRADLRRPVTRRSQLASQTRVLRRRRSPVRWERSPVRWESKPVRSESKPVRSEESNPVRSEESKPVSHYEFW